MSPGLARKLSALQPVVLENGRALVVGARSAPCGEMQTASGVHHPLREFSSTATLSVALQRDNLAAIQELWQRAVKPSLATGWDVLGLVVSQALPGLQPQAQVRVAELRRFPGPDLPQPSLYWGGRFWTLQDSDDLAGSTMLVVGSRKFTLSGQFMTVNSVEGAWMKAIVSAAKREPDRAGEVDPVPTEDRKRFEAAGFHQQGPLFVMAGSPPLLGHIIPSHYNRYLYRRSNSDLAVALPYRLPVTLSGIRVLALSKGRWEPFSCPLCLGSSPALDQADLKNDPRSIINYLRWAATRIATNGRFHENH